MTKGRNKKTKAKVEFTGWKAPNKRKHLVGTKAQSPKSLPRRRASGLSRYCGGGYRTCDRSADRRSAMSRSAAPAALVLGLPASGWKGTSVTAAQQAVNPVVIRMAMTLGAYAATPKSARELTTMRPAMLICGHAQLIHGRRTGRRAQA
jgi:hypothetical protein